LNGGATLPGHVLSMTMDASGVWSSWHDLALNPVSNDQLAMNSFGFDISSLFIDLHDTTGNTIYVTVAGVPNPYQTVRVVYRSSDGGAHWSNIQSHLPNSAANSLVIDPVDPNTAYVATDGGVFFTRNVTACGNSSSDCWSAFGTGLPVSPVVALSAAPIGTSPNVLVAGTFGRGVWQIPLATAGIQLTSATVSPASLDFGTVAFGTTSATQPVALMNTGGIALLPGAITVNGDFRETDSCSNATVNSQSSCAIQVTFRPAQNGSRAGQLIISANVAGGTLAIPLSGAGAPPGVVSLAPTTIDFGQVKVGSTSKPLSITAENSGGTPVAISVAVSGPFVLASNSCGTTLAANADCQLTVEFQPTSSGPATGAVTFVDEPGTQSVQLTGTGAAPPTDNLSATSLAFPEIVVEQSSAPLTVTLTNSGDLPLTSIAATKSGPFQVSNNCTAQLAAHSNCSFSVVFVPIQAGAQTGTLTVSDALNAGQLVSLTGTGLLPPAFSANPTSLSFAGQPVGVASSPSTLIVTNSGGASMANVGFQITGPSAGSFSTGTTTCGATLEAGASCTIQVVFTPASSGGSAAGLTITSSTNGVKALTVPLSGIGQSAAGLGVNPPQLTFGAVEIGQSSAAQTVSISNTGGTSANGFALTIAGPFSLSQNNCSASLAGGASCTAGVVFTPTSRGALTGMLTASSSSLPTPATVVLSGIGGLTGAVAMTPALVNFPTTGVGTTSSPVTVTISNSSAAVALDDLKLSTSPGFKLATTTCAESLAPGASCTAGVSFAPTNPGTQSGTLTLTSSTLAASANVPLSGMGFDFQATMSGASSQTVASGQTASFSIKLAPSSGSAATFTFQCATLPAYAVCNFNPSSANVAANATGTQLVQVTTSQTTAALVRPPSPAGWLGLPVALALLVLPIAGRRRKVFFPLLVFAYLVIGFTGCSSSGGGGGGTPPPPAAHTTPAGTYSIPVTVTSNGVQHTVTLTLVVD
jgi:hypothetical protein